MASKAKKKAAPKGGRRKQKETKAEKVEVSTETVQLLLPGQFGAGGLAVRQLFPQIGARLLQRLAEARDIAVAKDAPHTVDEAVLDAIAADEKFLYVAQDGFGWGGTRGVDMNSEVRPETG